jgi:hypothetical protein
VGLLSPPVIEGGPAVAGRPGRGGELGAARRGGGGAASRVVEAGGWGQGRTGAPTTVAAELETALGLEAEAGGGGGRG